MSQTPPTDFIHLRVHSAYSLAEGAIKLDDLVTLAKKRQMPAVAVTDTNNMFGAMAFSNAAAKEGIQPILGCQLDIYTDSFFTVESGLNQTKRETTPIVLLVQSEQGYRNLCKVVSAAYLNKESGEPVGVDISEFRELSDGLICLTGGPDGPIGRAIKTGDQKVVSHTLSKLKQLFGDRLYIELMRHGRWDHSLERKMIELAHSEDVPLVATNNCFFPDESYFEAHNALLCISGGRYISEPDRRQETPDHYFKSSREMIELFRDVPEAVHNTVNIAKRCGYFLEEIEPELPAFETSEGRTEAEELRVQVEKGLQWRLKTYVYDDKMSDETKKQVGQEYIDRMDMELGIISEMGFDGYFLIVADFIQWAKDHDIPVGPGRGSGAASVVAWSLKITDLDPIKYGLLFERFLNPERVSMPDFDIDFCQSRRDEVIKYVQDKYGKDRVAQIITFGKLQARAVVRDVGRVLQMPYGQVDKISKMIPNNPANPITLKEAIEGDPGLRRLQREDESVSRLLRIALKLEGLFRHASTHAAGIVIGNKRLDEILPLYKDARSDMAATQFSMKYVEPVSLVKFDFLGLKTLTVLQKALENIKETHNREIDLLSIPTNDKKTFEMMSEGAAVGVFQFEAAFIQDVLTKAKPDRLQDLIALTSLNRPGPMDNIPDYIEIKRGDKKPNYHHDKLEPVLEETYGIMIYQEQVMEAAKRLAGYTLGGADLLRRAMGKKIKEAMDAEREKFVKGSKENSDVPADRANDIFDLIAKFAGYGFNKAHAAAYSLISYQCAYLKANYPVEYMAAIMTLDMGNTDKLNVYRQDLRRMGIELLPPSINHSRADFSVEVHDGKPAVRYALAALKGAGAAAMAALVDERSSNGEYKTLKQFISRIDASAFNKRQIEVLAAAGAFDEFDYDRSQIVQAADYLMSQATKWSEERQSGQSSLFAVASASDQESQNGWNETLHMPEGEPWGAMERLQNEFSAIGFYLSDHPLHSKLPILESKGYYSHAKLLDTLQNSSRKGMRCDMAGVVVKRQERRSDRGRWAFVTLSEPTGLYDVMFFTEELMAYRDILEAGQIISLKVEAKMREGDIRLNAKEVEPLENILSRSVRAVEIILKEPDDVVHVETFLRQIQERDGSTGAPVTVDLVVPVRDHNKWVKLRFNEKISLSSDDHMTLTNMNNLTVRTL